MQACFAKLYVNATEHTEAPFIDRDELKDERFEVRFAMVATGPRSALQAQRRTWIPDFRQCSGLARSVSMEW